MDVRVIIADDHKMIREGIKQLLEMEGDIKIVAEANDGIECLEIVSSTVADILLLDINMPQKNGIEVLKELRKKKIPIKVLMLTVHNEIEYLLNAVDIGIDGYILKDSESAELRQAIFSILSGEKYIQPSLIPLLNSKMISRNNDNSKVKMLTRREVEVLILIAKGMFNKEIGEQLDISERTVKNHVSNIFKKISVVDRTQAAVFAIRSNLIKI